MGEGEGHSGRKMVFFLENGHKNGFCAGTFRDTPGTFGEKKNVYVPCPRVKKGHVPLTGWDTPHKKWQNYRPHSAAIMTCRKL